MNNAHIILAAKPFGADGSTAVSSGSLNVALAETAKRLLSNSHSLSFTNIAEPYDAQTERERLISSDLVIMQFPVYWFNIPHYLKEYIDRVYASPGFWQNEADPLQYGRGGKLKGEYMLSMTFNAPPQAFSDAGIAAGSSPDDLLNNLHLTQRYIGMKALPSFVAYDVYSIYKSTGEENVNWAGAFEKHLKQFVI